MAPTPAVTDLEQLKDRPVVARLLAWNPDAVTGAKWDREELTVWIARPFIRQACSLLKGDPELQFDFLCDLTCVDWYPAEPRFELVYHLLSIPRKQRVRLKVNLTGENPHVESLVVIWPAANYFEREVFDLFGIQFDGHPYLRRIMLPDHWQGHPLRKDYPVEGYR